MCEQGQQGEPALVAVNDHTPSRMPYLRSDSCGQCLVNAMLAAIKGLNLKKNIFLL